MDECEGLMRRATWRWSWSASSPEPLFAYEQHEAFFAPPLTHLHVPGAHWQEAPLLHPQSCPADEEDEESFTQLHWPAGHLQIAPDLQPHCAPSPAFTQRQEPGAHWHGLPDLQPQSLDEPQHEPERR